MAEPCPISGAGHYWKLRPYERYISRGQCECRAVRFFSDNIAKENIARAEFLNKKKGKEGEKLSKRIAITLAVRAEQTPDNLNKEVKPMTIDLEEKARFEEMSMQDRSKWIKAHLEEIVADIRSMSKREVLSKWPFGPSTIRNLIDIHAPELKGKREKSGPKPVKEAATEKAEPQVGALPPFPPFNDSWISIVQIEWFKAYVELDKNRAK